MKGLAEVLALHDYSLGHGRGSICDCGFVPTLKSGALTTQQDHHRAHLADVVLAWVAAGLDGARPGVWEWLPYSKIPEASDADAVLDIIRGALGVPQEATGAAVSDEGRSVGFGDGSDDEGGL